MNEPWRWIPPLQADGSSQMAIDGWMLEQLAAGAAPMLRLYRWQRPTLSLGRHQSRLEPHWPALQRAGLIDLVRRPSGGRAVLHAGELTYALAWRPPSQRRQEAYGLSCRWLQAAFEALGLPLQFGSVAAAQAGSRASCFASGTAADLVHANGAKRIGSAQLWRGPALLQHGSILLAPPAALWQEVFGEAPPALPALPPELHAAALEGLLRQAAEHQLCQGPLLELQLPARSWRQRDGLELER
jgi:lipoate-protein ligase A